MKESIQNSVKFAYKLCEKLNAINIKIWLAYGSSLGAVRDGGIIKGDDDVDLMMWDEDYQKLGDLIREGVFFDLPSFKYDFRGLLNGGRVCKMTLGNKTLPAANRWEPSSVKKIHCASCGVVISNGDLCQDCIEYKNQFHIDIFYLKKSPDGIRCYDSCVPETNYKLYHYENLRKIKFENFDFYVSKYAEKTLDFLYNGIDGTSNTWRTVIAQDDYNFECAIKEDEDQNIFTGYVEGVFDLFHVGHLRMLERSSKIFDKVIAGVHSDETVFQYKEKKPVIPYEHRIEILKSCKFVDDVIEAPLLGVNGIDGLEFLNKNNLDYLVHSYAKQEFLDYYYTSIIKDHRLFLLDETEGYHTADLINKIIK